MIELSCQNCNNSFFVYPHRKDTATTCSLSCKHETHGDKVKGEKAYNWKGGVSENLGGYLVKHRGGKYIHRLVWEESNGEIPEGYVVHHINEDKKDNRIENLELMTRGDHMRHHDPMGWRKRNKDA